MSTEISITLPSWMVEKLSAIAEVCEKSVDDVVASFFAAEVVHTQPAARVVAESRISATSPRTTASLCP